MYSQARPTELTCIENTFTDITDDQAGTYAHLLFAKLDHAPGQSPPPLPLASVVTVFSIAFPRLLTCQHAYIHPSTHQGSSTLLSVEHLTADLDDGQHLLLSSVSKTVFREILN